VKQSIAPVRLFFVTGEKKVEDDSKGQIGKVLDDLRIRRPSSALMFLIERPDCVF
jgi:hypothetical protein